MTLSLRRVAAAGVLAAATACTSSTEPRTPQELRTLPRALSQAEVDVRDAANGFALPIFQRISAEQPGENVFVSPLSVSMALGMVMNGAKGETLDEMKQVLGFGEAELAAVQNGYRDLSALLRGLDPATSFQIANSIWYRQDLTVVPSFLDAGRTYFDAEIRSLDFTDAEGTKSAVNGWVKEKTKGRIPTILEEVSPDDVMYLTNAIWFKGEWRTRFDKARTYDGRFTTARGTTQTVRMMTQTADSTTGLRVSSDPGIRAFELPYGNGAYAMTIVLPTAGTDVDALASTLTTDRWNRIVEQMRDERGLEIHLPKFTLEYKRELRKDLHALGMRRAMGGTADLTGIFADGGAQIAYVTHKTFVQVDEVGTEAAAVTNIGIRVTSLPPAIHVDRPFIFAIRERLTGTILFIGKMTEIP